MHRHRASAGLFESVEHVFRLAAIVTVRGIASVLGKGRGRAHLLQHAVAIVSVAERVLPTTTSTQSGRAGLGDAAHFHAAGGGDSAGRHYSSMCCLA